MIKNLWTMLNHPLRIPSLHTMLHSTNHWFHMAYSGLVAIEAHGTYAYAAGGMFTVACIALLLHDEV